MGATKCGRRYVERVDRKLSASQESAADAVKLILIHLLENQNIYPSISDFMGMSGSIREVKNN